MSVCVQLDQKLADALVGYPKFFDDLPSPRRSIRQCERAPAAGSGQRAVPPRAIRNGVEAAGFSARRRMPCFCLVTFGKSKLSQGAQRRRGLGEAELCLDGDLGLRVPAMSERDQAGRLRLGEEKISRPGHAAAPLSDSPLQYAVLGPSCAESIRCFPQGRSDPISRGMTRNG